MATVNKMSHALLTLVMSVILDALQMRDFWSTKFCYCSY